VRGQASLLVDEPEAGVVVLTVNRPHVHNAFDWATLEAFRQAVDRLVQVAAVPDGALRAVIVTGAGTRAFSSGGDLRALHGSTGPDDGRRLASTMGDALCALEGLPVPVLAAVNGYAIGGGAELALACDLRFVEETARLGLVHLKLAEVPGWGGGTRLARLVGHGRAARMLLEAADYPADELERLGVADFVVGRGQALDEALRFARRVAQADPAAVRAVKRLLVAAHAMDREDALSFERELFVELWPAPAHLRAMAEFTKTGDA
jgi:enoyl-CoA hydratase